MKLFSIALLAVLFTSCMSSKKYYTKNYHCLQEKTIAANANNAEYTQIRSAFNDTLNDWIYVKKVRYYEGYPAIFNMKLDTLVFFNDSLTRAFLFLQLQRNSNCKCTDIVVLISAEKIDSAWQFYNCVNFQYIISEGRTSRYSFEELSEMSVKTVMGDGLVKKFKACKVNDEYFYSKKWFPEKRQYYHNKFLNNQY